MKQHLVGINGQISRCLKVPYDVREKIQNNLTEFNLNKLEKKKADALVGMTFHENRDTNNVIQNDAPLNTMDELTRLGSGGPVRAASVDYYFAPRTVAGAQPGIKATLAGTRRLERDSTTCCNNLQKIAIRLLSQTSTSSGCERNWSVFEHIHTDRRNKLEEDKLCDLIFINYNLKLKNRDHYNTEKLNIDPFDSEWISSSDFWVLDDQGSTPTPELNYEVLMAALDEEMGRTTIGVDEGTSRKRRRTEDDAISSTGFDSEDVADIGDEVAQAENLMDTGPSGVVQDDQDTRYLFDDTSLF
ncbi:hypothetical protein LINPERHAP1_LOCUS30376 [Linum perenne]